MNLLCGSTTSEQNSEALNQYEEGQRAHTIKLYSKPINFNLNLINKNILNKQNNDFHKNLLNQKLNKEILLTNKIPLESNKSSNNTSELEIIEYPINELKNNDFDNINDVILSKAKDYINDKTQNDILDYLKEKQGLNYLSLLLESDKYSYHSKNGNNEKEDNDNSSKSDEVICSYVEIDHNNSIISRMQKEKSAIKQSSKIFSKIHQPSYSDYSLPIKNYGNNNNKLMKTKTMNDDRSKNKNEEKKIKVTKNMKKNKTDMKYKKIVNHSNTKTNSRVKKIKKNDKDKRIKSFIDIRQNEFATISDLINSNKKKIIVEKKNNLDTFRSIEILNGINPININYRKALKRLNSKCKQSPGKSQIINTERTKSNFQINKNINTINSKEKYYKHIYKNIKGKSISKSKNNINSKGKINKNDNPLFNSINIKRNENLNINKGNFLSLKKSLLTSTTRINSKNKMKQENISTANSKSKLKLRKLLTNNMNNSKCKCDLSMYNINCLSNNSKLKIKKDNNKALSKIMNKSELNKKINNSIHIKNYNHNKQLKNNLMQKSISKIFKG